jgi:hypothetical protein
MYKRTWKPRLKITCPKSQAQKCQNQGWSLACTQETSSFIIMMYIQPKWERFKILEKPKVAIFTLKRIY